MSIEYYKDVESTLASFNPECVSQIQKATEDIKVLLKTTEGQNEIRKKFKYLHYIFKFIF